MLQNCIRLLLGTIGLCAIGACGDVSSSEQVDDTSAPVLGADSGPPPVISIMDAPLGTVGPIIPQTERTILAPHRVYQFRAAGCSDAKPIHWKLIHQPPAPASVSEKSGAIATWKMISLRAYKLEVNCTRVLSDAREVAVSATIPIEVGIKITIHDRSPVDETPEIVREPVTILTRGRSYYFRGNGCTKDQPFKWELQRLTPPISSSAAQISEIASWTFTSVVSRKITLRCAHTGRDGKVTQAVASALLEVRPEIEMLDSEQGAKGILIPNETTKVAGETGYIFRLTWCASDKPFTWTLKRTNPSPETFAPKAAATSAWKFHGPATFELRVQCTSVEASGSRPIEATRSFEVVNAESLWPAGFATRSPLELTADDFLVVRKYVEALMEVPTIEPADFCIPFSAQKILANGDYKYACRLKRFKGRFALLFARNPANAVAEITKELSTLTAIREETAKLGFPVTTVPFDNHILSVPCVGAAGRCAGYIEPWFDDGNFRPWHGLKESERQLPHVMSNAGLSPEGVARACAELRNHLAVLGANYFIADVQGFIKFTEPEQGRILLTDPLGARRIPNKTDGWEPSRAANVTALTELIKKWCK